MGVDNITKASTMQEGGRFLPDRREVYKRQESGRRDRRVVLSDRSHGSQVRVVTGSFQVSLPKMRFLPKGLYGGRELNVQNSR